MTEYGSARNGAEGIEEAIQGTEEISVGTGTNDRASDIGNTDTADSVAGNRDIDTADGTNDINGNGIADIGNTDIGINGTGSTADRDIDIVEGTADIVDGNIADRDIVEGNVDTGTGMDGNDTADINIDTGNREVKGDIGNMDSGIGDITNGNTDTVDIDIQDSGINGNGDIAKRDTDKQDARDINMDTGIGDIGNIDITNGNTDTGTNSNGNGDTDKPKKGGVDNLVDLRKRTAEERRAISSKGGKLSVESRRRKRDLREIAKTLLAAEMEPDQVTEILGTAQNLLDGDKSVAAVLTARLAQEAGKGNHKAYEVLRDTAGYKPKDNVSIEGMMTDADRALIAQVSSRLGLHNDIKQGE